MKRGFLYAVLAMAAATFIYPFLWMAATTFKPSSEVGTLSLVPDHPTFENYRMMWSRARVGRALLNSLAVATVNTAAVLVFGSITAYALARLRFTGRGLLMGASLAALLVPGQLTLIPTYALMVQLGWVDTYAALTVPYLFNVTGILILRQFEPLSNLDAQLRGQMRGEIARLQRRLGTTTLYVTHDQVEAMTLADRLVILDGGRIQQIGAPLEVYQRPANRFVAGFIGTPPINFVEGSLGPIAVDGGAAWGIRPEDVLLVPGGTTGSIPAEVVLVELLGAHAHVHLEAGGQRLIAVVAGPGAPAMGAAVHVGLDPARVHRFDSGGGAVRPRR